MSRYAFRKPSIIQFTNIAWAAARGDIKTLVLLLDELAADDILDLPFSELTTIVEDYARAMQAWQEEQDALPDGLADYLAGLVEGEDG